MKTYKFLLCLILTAITSQSYALDLNSFHGLNFEPIGPGCGLHLEVSGKNLIATDIIPPSKVFLNNVCSNELYGYCGGQSLVLTCDTSGKCIRPGKAILYLLNDGNVVSGFENKKFFNSRTDTYFYCRN